MRWTRGAWAMALVGACSSGAPTPSPSRSEVPITGAEGRDGEVASPDGARTYSPPSTWRPIAGLPASCGARLSAAPDAVPPLTRRPCAGERVGCERHEPDSTTTWLHFALYEPLVHDERGIHLSYMRSADGLVPEARALAVVQRIDGDIRNEFVATSTPGCAVDLHASRHGLAARAIVTGGDAPVHLLAVSSWEAPLALTARVATPGGDAPLSQYAALGVDLVAVEAISVGGTVRAAIFDLHTGTFADAGSTALGRLQRPLATGDGVIGLARDGAALVRVGLAGDVVSTPPQTRGSRVASFALDRARDDARVWIETDDTSVQAWSQVSGATPVPVPVDAVDAPVVAGDGWVAQVISPGRIRATRIVDGAHRELTCDAEAPCVFALGIDDSAVWAATSSVPEGAPGYPAVHGLVRLALDV